MGTEPWEAAEDSDECPHAVTYDEKNEAFLQMFDLFEELREGQAEHPDEAKKMLVAMLEELGEKGKDGNEGSSPPRGDDGQRNEDAVVQDEPPDSTADADADVEADGAPKTLWIP